MSIALDLSSEIIQACPTLTLGHILADVTISSSPPQLWAQSQALLALKAQLRAEDIREIPALSAARAVYKALGQDPSRYRLSAESLHRRVMKDQGLYQLCNVVDLVNLASLQSGISIGAYDRDHLQGDLVLRVGQENEPYFTLAQTELNIAKLPVLADDLGAFGNPSRDSARTAIQPHTQRIWIVVFAFGATDPLDTTLEFLCDGLKLLARAENVEVGVQRV